MTLAEMLKARGYRTGGFVARLRARLSKWGINQGFDTYFDDFDLSQVPRRVARRRFNVRATKSLDKALPWIEQVERRAVLCLDPPLRCAFAVPRRRSRSQRATRRIPTTARSLSPTARSRRLIATLAGPRPRTIARSIVVMGDHGESLGDHGESAHGFFVYNSVDATCRSSIRAPFSRIGTAASPIRCDRSTSCRPCSTCSACQRRRSGISGDEPRAADDRGESGARPRRVLRSDVSAASLRLERSARAAIGPLQSDRRAASELYDLDRDPSETTNLFAERQALGDRMIAQLRALESGFTKVVAAMPAADVDPEARERLAALGYVGTFVASASTRAPAAPIRRTRSDSSTS